MLQRPCCFARYNALSAVSNSDSGLVLVDDEKAQHPMDKVTISRSASGACGKACLIMFLIIL